MIQQDLFLIALGLVIGAYSGMLGVGGGLLMVPALIFLPGLLGLKAYSIQTATGISIAQSVVGGASGLAAHYFKGMVRLGLVAPLVTGSIVGGFMGGYMSGYLADWVIYALFAALMMAVLVLSFFHPKTDYPDDVNQPHRLKWSAGIPIGAGISFVAANTGIGGAALLTPLLITVQKVPTRLAIGTGAAFVVITGISATLGKWMMNLIPFPDVIWVSAGALIGGNLGARLGHRLPAPLLRKILVVTVLLALIRVLIQMAQLP